MLVFPSGVWGFLLVLRGFFTQYASGSPLVFWIDGLGIAFGLNSDYLIWNPK